MHLELKAGDIIGLRHPKVFHCTSLPTIKIYYRVIEIIGEDALIYYICPDSAASLTHCSLNKTSFNEEDFMLVTKEKEKIEELISIILLAG